MSTIPAFTQGDLVTITYTDGDSARVWHGRFERINNVVTRDYGTPSYGSRYSRAFLDQGPDSTDGEPWITLRAETAYNFDPQGLPSEGEHWSIDTFGRIMIATDLPGLTITPVTDEGRAYIASKESADSKRERLIALIRETMPEVATELDDAIETLVEQATERGEQREYERNNGSYGYTGY